MNGVDFARYVNRRRCQPPGTFSLIDCAQVKVDESCRNLSRKSLKSFTWDFFYYNLWHTIIEAKGCNAKESKTPYYSRTSMVQKMIQKIIQINSYSNDKYNYRYRAKKTFQYNFNL